MNIIGKFSKLQSSGLQSRAQDPTPQGETRSSGNNRSTAANLRAAISSRFGSQGKVEEKKKELHKHLQFETGRLNDPDNRNNHKNVRVYQGPVGNCTLLATGAATLYNKPKDFKNLFLPGKDPVNNPDEIRMQFGTEKGARKIFTPPVDVNLKKPGFVRPDTEPGMKALELGYAEFLKGQNPGFDTATLLDGLHVGPVLKHLNPGKSVTEYFGETDLIPEGSAVNLNAAFNDNVRCSKNGDIYNDTGFSHSDRQSIRRDLETMANNPNENIGVCFFRSNVDLPGKFMSHHAYGIKEVDFVNEKLHLIDPHDSTKPLSMDLNAFINDYGTYLGRAS